MCRLDRAQLFRTDTLYRVAIYIQLASTGADYGDAFRSSLAASGCISPCKIRGPLYSAGGRRVRQLLRKWLGLGIESAPVDSGSSHEEVSFMLRWALIFFIVALIAAVLGFTGIALAAAGVAKTLFYIFVVLFVLSLLGHVARRP
jgi:Small integral membrane protein